MTSFDFCYLDVLRVNRKMTRSDRNLLFLIGTSQMSIGISFFQSGNAKFRLEIQNSDRRFSFSDWKMTNSHRHFAFSGWKSEIPIRKLHFPIGKSQIPVYFCFFQSENDKCTLAFRFSDWKMRNSNWEIANVNRNFEIPIYISRFPFGEGLLPKRSLLWPFIK